MKFTVDSGVLVEALGWVAKSLPARPANPVLAGVKLALAGADLTISAFDYEQSSVAVVEVDPGEDGVVIVSGKLFADIARALRKGPVTVTADAVKAQVTSGASKFSLAAFPTDEYPNLPVQPEPVGSVDAAEFAEAIRMVSPAAGRDDMLPVLTAINVAIDPAAGVLSLAATDRFRLAVKQVAFEAAPGAVETTALVPARILDGWAKALTGPEGTRFTFGSGGSHGNLFAADTGTKSATVRLIDGEYPKVAALIPSTFAAEATVRAADLHAALRRVALVADRSAPAMLAFSADGVEVTAGTDDNAFEQVEAGYAGEPVSIGFNIAYLLDGLGVLGDREAVIGLVASNKPAVIRPAGAAEHDSTYLLMPMRSPR